MWNGYVLTLIRRIPSLNISMVEYETVSVGELFQEELDCLKEQYDNLIDKGTTTSLKAAEDLEHVIRYFEARLGNTTELYVEGGPTSDDTLH